MKHAPQVPYLCFLFSSFFYCFCLLLLIFISPLPSLPFPFPFPIAFSCERSVKVEVPGGVESGIAIHVRGEGAEGEKGAPNGDLYVQLEVAADPYFERSGADLHVTADINIAQVHLTIVVLWWWWCWGFSRHRTTSSDPLTLSVKHDSSIRLL